MRKPAQHSQSELTELHSSFPRPLEKPKLSLNKKQGYSKISAILLLTGIIVATALTFLLVNSRVT